MTDVTRDSISLRDAGAVFLEQPAKGARTTLDSILLADFCRLKPRDRVLEPGAGTGVISLLLARKHPAARFTALENDSLACGLLCRNIEANNLAGRIAPLERDLLWIKGTIEPRVFDAIVANPPYVKSGTGRTSPYAGRRSARHDQGAPLSAWLDLGSLLRNKGRYFLVFTAARAGELIALLRERGLEPKRLRFVHPRLSMPASLVLVEAVASSRPGVEILPPLVTHGPGPGCSDELKRIYGLLPG